MPWLLSSARELFVKLELPLLLAVSGLAPPSDDRFPRNSLSSPSDMKSPVCRSSLAGSSLRRKHQRRRRRQQQSTKQHPNKPSATAAAIITARSKVSLLPLSPVAAVDVPCVEPVAVAVPSVELLSLLDPAPPTSCWPEGNTKRRCGDRSRKPALPNTSCTTTR